MKRNKPKQIKHVDLILTADWHLTDKQPECRVDDFYEAQFDKVRQIAALQAKYDCPVIHAGDLFDYWKPNFPLLIDAIKYLPKQFYTIYGNHDLPQHNLELSKKSGIAVLEAAGVVNVLSGTHWMQRPKPVTINNIELLVWHVMTWQGTTFPGDTSSPARSLLKKLPYELILTGHNHKAFVEEFGRRVLVNPGAITRQSIDQADFKPAVYLYRMLRNTITRHELKVSKNVVKMPEKREEKQQRDERLNLFVEKIAKQGNFTTNFVENIMQALETQQIDEETRHIILESINH